MRNFPTPTKTVFATFFLSLMVWAGLFHGKLPAITDVFLYNYPSQSVSLMEFGKGRIPLWDATTGCGTPQLANNQSACLYPPFWLWNFTGLSHWLVWMSLLHSGLAFLGFYFWGRTQKIFPLWAALGALSFAGSLHITRCWGYPVFSSTQAWTPWVFWAASKFLEEGKSKWWLALTLSVGLQVLAGYPFFSFYVLVFLAAWVFFQTGTLKRKMGLLAAVLAAFAWTAADWLPFLDFLGYSTRGGWGSPDKFPFFSKANEYLTLLSPTALGMPETMSYLGVTANSCFMMYFGLIPLLAWVIGFFLKNIPGHRFWGIGAGVWLLWLMGTRFPIFKILPESLMETLNPSKAVGIFLFAACSSAGFTLTRFFRDRWDEKVRARIYWVVCLLWLLDVLLIPVRVVHPVPDPFQKAEIKDWAAKVKVACGAQRVVSLHSKQKEVFYGQGSDAKVFEEAADGWANDLLNNSNAVWGIRSAHAYLSLWTISMDKLWKAFNKPDTYNSRLADVAGVRGTLLPLELSPPHYRVLEKKEASSPAELARPNLGPRLEASAQGQDFLAQNMFCRPDAWVALGERTLPNQDAVVEELLEEPGGGEVNEVLLEVGTHLPQAPRALTPLVGKLGWDRVSGAMARYGGNFIKPGWLFWDETYTPGWRAWVDGMPIGIQRADGFFMAVPVDTNGDHQVEFRYEPVAFRLGLFISLVFLSLGLGLVFSPSPLTGERRDEGV